MKSLITGITGFVGSHLAELLLKEGHNVYGISRFYGGNDNLEKIEDDLNLYDVDLLDEANLFGLISEIRPDYIFHLAAQSFVPVSWKSPNETLKPNILGSYNLFEAVRKAEIDPVIQIAGSSEEYGLVYPHESPIDELQPLRPMSPYGVSKIAMDFAGFQHHQSYGTKIILTRAFNHEGPRRGEGFVISNFAKQIIEIEKGKRKILEHGNLTAIRDFTDVRDMVKAYLLAVKKCNYGDVYNISSGVGYEIEDILHRLLNISGVGVQFMQDKSRMRPSDVPTLVGNPKKFYSKTGWIPKIPIEKTLKDTLDYWRKRL